MERWLEGPMVFLAFVWIGLMIVEFAGGQSAWLEKSGNIIWIVFIADFLLRLFLAERKFAYVRRNWLTLISLALPALRIFRLTRVLRLSRATRGLRLLRLTTSLNRSVRALMRSMSRKGVGYVLALTLIVTFSGAAGMLALEEGQFTTYWDALWWTAMIVTTMGSDFWPRSLEGRILCLALASYAFSVFGYVTAALASFLVERGQPRDVSEHRKLQDELVELRNAVSRLADRSGAAPPPDTVPDDKSGSQGI
jgi:voltage-gated potassium channel